MSLINSTFAAQNIAPSPHPPRWHTNPEQVTPHPFVTLSEKGGDTHLAAHHLSDAERGNVIVKGLLQEDNTDPDQGSNPESSDSITILKSMYNNCRMEKRRYKLILFGVQ